MQIDLKEFNTLIDFKKFISHKTIFEHTNTLAEGVLANAAVESSGRTAPAVDKSNLSVEKLTVPMVKVKNGNKPTNIVVVPLNFLNHLIERSNS